MSICFIYNDLFFKDDDPIIGASSRGLKFGDGLFETIKMINGKIILSDYHFVRLFEGMKVLQFNIPSHFTKEYFEKRIAELANRNNHNKSVRIRLTIFRSNSTLLDVENNNPEYILQTYEIAEEGFNNEGLFVDIYSLAKKNCDILSNLKTNNFLPYVLASFYAKKNSINDCLLLNIHDRLADSTNANIFIVNNKNIYTPALNEGCIAGTIRRLILDKFHHYPVIEKSLSIDDLTNADEVFLTNSISLLKWVKQFRSANYDNKICREVYNFLIQTI